MGNIGRVQGVVSFEPLEVDEDGCEPETIEEVDESGVEVEILRLGGEEHPILEPVPDPLPKEPEVVGSITGRMTVHNPPLQTLPKGPLSDDAKCLMQVLEGLARV